MNVIVKLLYRQLLFFIARFGTRGVRIYRLLLEKHYLEQNEVKDFHVCIIMIL